MASFRTLAVAAFCVVLTTCSKINQENYSKLETGMSRTEVEAILDKPTKYSDALDMSSYTWGGEKVFTDVQYATDKALLFSGQGLK